VASVLEQHGFSTLLIDLLTEKEEIIDQKTAEFRFDIYFLAKRLDNIVKYVLEHHNLQDMKVGYFGASTGGQQLAQSLFNFPANSNFFSFSLCRRSSNCCSSDE
jgi:hypothetical protein